MLRYSETPFLRVMLTCAGLELAVVRGSCTTCMSKAWRHRNQASSTDTCGDAEGNTACRKSQLYSDNPIAGGAKTISSWNKPCQSRMGRIAHVHAMRSMPAQLRLLLLTAC